jgi:prephenate dehydratase
VKIKDHNDFWMQASRQQGKSDAMLKVFNEQYQKPLTDVLNKLENKGISMRDIENYGICKQRY